MQFQIHDPNGMTDVASDICARAAIVVQREARACVCTLSGDLGAGKTTLVQAIARELGIADTIQSPTFVIRKSYTTTDPVITQLIHIDAYRLESGSELTKLHFHEDLQQQKTLICLEWPERIADLKLVPDIQITIEHAGENERIVTILP